MELTRLIDDLQRALADHADLHGAKVSMVISSARDSQPDMSISFRVPRARQEEEKTADDAPECAEVTPQKRIDDAMELLLGQMDMTQERMAIDQPDEKAIAEINASMTGMAHAISALSNERRCWEGETANRLRMMHEVEMRNDEKIRKWEDEHA